METILVQLTYQKVIGLLNELEKLHLIKILKKDTNEKIKLSDKYSGILSKEEGHQLNEHIKQMRDEWNSI